MRVARRLLIGLLPVASLIACSTTYMVRPEDAAQAIVDIISEQNDYELDVNQVTCPDGIQAEVGVQFDCHFTGRGGDYVAHMKIEKVEGDQVLFAINAGPVGT